MNVAQTPTPPRADPRGGGRNAGRPVNISALTRRVHGYLGMLIAPSVLFFAVTGALQIFSLHEAHGDYTPPAAVVTLASLHKDQRLATPAHHPSRPRRAADESHGDSATRPPAPPVNWALKLAFLAVAVGLFVSTCLGVWMGLQARLRRNVHLILLAIGTAVPILLALI